MKVTTFGWWTYPNRFLNIQNPPNTWWGWVFGTPNNPFFQEMWMGVQSYLLNRCFFWCLGKKGEHLSFQNMVFGFWGKCEGKEMQPADLKKYHPQHFAQQNWWPAASSLEPWCSFFRVCQFFFHFLTEKENCSTSTKKKHSKWVSPRDQKKTATVLLSNSSSTDYWICCDFLGANFQLTSWWELMVGSWVVHPSKFAMMLVRAFWQIATLGFG